MTIFLKRFKSLWVAPIVALTMSAVGSAQGAADTNAAPAELIVPKSVFQDDLKNGKDPFFPKSSRRSAKVPVDATPIIAPEAQLALKGISVPANRRFALINNKPLAAGESDYVKIGNGQIKVHCHEIRENSVVITVEGNPEQKELKLREGL